MLQFSKINFILDKLKRMSLIIFGLLICFLANIKATPPNLTNSISQFATDLYTTVIVGQNSKNIVLSPISAQIVLTLTYMGAEGNTASQMLNGLHLSGSKGGIAGQMQQLIEPLQNSTSLKVANNIFIMKSYTVKSTFGAVAKKDFYSGIQSVNFAQNIAAANLINTWVANETDNKITNLLSANSLNKNTRMVLVNAIYFKGVWQQQFLKNRTTKASFYTNTSTTVQVNMMHVQAKFRYGQLSNLNANCIELPYKDGNLSMLIILPHNRTGLAKLETDLKTVNIIELSKTMRLTDVVLSIPKFQIEFQLSLVGALRKLGMTDMFSGSANFSALLNSDEPIHVSDVVQKAFIEVNEEGTVAAAATAVTVVKTLAIAIRPPPIVFDADHPFTFILKSNNDILFMGRFTQ